MNPTCFLEHYGVDENTIVYTMWDSTRLEGKYVEVLNKSKLIMVPSQFNKDVFVNDGVWKPIIVIPHGFTHEFFGWNKRPHSVDKIVFGSAGQVVNDPSKDKKNMLNVIQCFKTAFPDDEQVRLKIKLDPGSVQIPDQNDTRIEVSSSYLEPIQMADWYHSLDCYVNLSKFEAFGRHLLESMACGTPLLTPRTGGIIDYFEASMGFHVDANRVPISDQSVFRFGDWFEPDLDQVVSKMRYIQRHPQCLTEKSKMSAIRAQDFNMNRFQDRFLDVISSFIY